MFNLVILLNETSRSKTQLLHARFGFFEISGVVTDRFTRMRRKYIVSEANMKAFFCAQMKTFTVMSREPVKYACAIFPR